jgi:diguanylate cyclase (GGDEF)-like protein
MRSGNRPEIIWGLGLDQDLAQNITQSLGAGYQVRNWPLSMLPTKRDLDKANPLAVWILLSVWNALPPSSRKALRDWELTQRVLVLDDPDHGPEVEEILALGFLTALKPPISENHIRDAVFRAKEVRGLYDDIFKMTREIMLERELLARKTDQILFLNNVLTRASQSLEPAVILGNAHDDLNLLMPFSGMQAAFWQPGEKGELMGELFLSPSLDVQTKQQWVEYLLLYATAMAGGPISAYTVELLAKEGPDKRLPMPSPTSTILLPLKVAGSPFGLLAIAKDKNLRLGKDQSQSLFAATNHLALALKNAMLFREVKAKADFDGLTRIHNRQSFDERLNDELKRHQRYHHPLSLLLFDLDHFKKINDTFGHQGGDMVLKEVGELLEESCRETDFTARYGGEEFVAILPQTTEDQAWVLAERIRRRIEHKNYQYAGKAFQVTASIGVATLLPGPLNKREDLIQMADKALYQAKSQGRNMVCASQPGAPSKVKVKAAVQLA